MRSLTWRQMHGVFDMSQHFWDYTQSGFDLAIVVIGILTYHITVNRKNKRP